MEVSIAKIVDDNTRHTVMGVAQNVRARTYNGGNMLLFDLTDNSGTMPFIAWNDAHDIFANIIKEKSTYKISGVVAKQNPRNNNRMEMKLFPDTRVEMWQDMKLEYVYGTLANAKKSSESTVRVKCITFDLGEEGEKTRNGDDMRRAVVMDGTDQVNALFIGNALVSSLTFADGAILNIDGRLVASNSGGHTLFVNAFEKTVDADLEKIWDSETRPAKRARVEPTIFKIVDIKQAEVGTRGDFTGIVRSCSAPMPTANDRIKRTFTIVDQSMAAVDVGLFTDKTVNIEANIGSIVKFDGIVSSYNLRSLTTNMLRVIDDKAMANWWSENACSVFQEISADPRSSASASADA